MPIPRSVWPLNGLADMGEPGIGTPGSQGIFL